MTRILLIGTGRFGRHHLRVLKELHEEGKIYLKGAVVRDAKKAKKITNEFKIQTFLRNSPALLKEVDAVVIVTPPETHFNLVKECIAYTNVFVEKPLAGGNEEARTLDRLARGYGRILMVGHIFRYHPVTEALKKLLTKKCVPKIIIGPFINPLSADQGRNPAFELLHLFDIVGYVFRKRPEAVWSRQAGRIVNVDIRYDRNHDAKFKLGWEGNKKERFLEFTYPTLTVHADFIENKIQITQKKNKRIIKCDSKEEPLRKELLAFIKCIRLGKKCEVDGGVGAKIVSIAELAVQSKSRTPKVAVIGGGIFGTSIAAEIGVFTDVTLFEKNAEIFLEGTHINQFRHHYGYHYPRSDETVSDIQNSSKDFEREFHKAIIKGIPTYYGLAKKDSLVSAKEFLAFCNKHKLPYEKKLPRPDILNKELIDLCVKVPEPSYDYQKLKDITIKRLKKIKGVNIRYKTLVTSCTLQGDGKKMIAYIENENVLKEEEFDFVINASYAHLNKLSDWMDFPYTPIRIDLAEVLIVKLPVPPISLTIIDGPFATLMPTGRPNEFTLYHVKESIIERYVPKNGQVRKFSELKSRRKLIYKESLKFFPILKNAEIVESRIVHRGVQAHREYDDVRVTELIEHGFGCWSVLSGKILSSVTIGKKIASIIKGAIKV